MRGHNTRERVKVRRKSARAMPMSVVAPGGGGPGEHDEPSAPGEATAMAATQGGETPRVTCP
eukprot:4848779-Lingulodinium_polyedra.AAC.1